MLERQRLVVLFARAALWWLVVAALMGAWLRWQVQGTAPFGFPFRFLTHAHSHVMFLGWAFNGLAAGLVYYLSPDKVSRLYQRLWVGLQLAVLGMAFSFPIQGYKAVSIAFSSLHMLLAVWLLIRLWVDTSKTGPGVLAFRWAVVFFLLASLGPFALAYTMSQGLSGSSWYSLSVYYYLHFQYNGWMIMALLSILFFAVQAAGTDLRHGIGLMGLGIVLAYAISALWVEPPVWVYVLALAGAGLQLVAAWLLYKGVRPLLKWDWNSWTGRLSAIAGVSFLLKLVLQLVAVVPEAGSLIFLNRNWLIAYFHLVFIGVISIGLLAWFIEKKWLQSSKVWWLLIVGFILSEVLLLLPGDFSSTVLFSSLFMLVALFVLAFQHTLIITEKPNGP